MRGNHPSVHLGRNLVAAERHDRVDSERCRAEQIGLQREAVAVAA